MLVFVFHSLLGGGNSSELSSNTPPAAPGYLSPWNPHYPHHYPDLMSSRHPILLNKEQMASGIQDLPSLGLNSPF